MGKIAINWEAEFGVLIVHSRNFRYFGQDRFRGGGGGGGGGGRLGLGAFRVYFAPAFLGFQGHPEGQELAQESDRTFSAETISAQ